LVLSERSVIGSSPNAINAMLQIEVELSPAAIALS
jgi:hypothetical protein